jgi:transcriptional regulator with XRE-family HTH domain
MQIRRARNNLKLSQHQLATLIGCGQPKIQKIEYGSQMIKSSDIEPLIEVLQFQGDQAESFRREARWAATVGRNDDLRGKPDWFRGFLQLENDAIGMRSWTGERIPGILQSYPFMLTMFQASGTPDVTEYAEARKRRKDLFSREHPPDCEFVISQAFFARLPHGFKRATALDQVQELIRLMDDNRNVSVLILPFEARLTFVPEDFTIFTLPDDQSELVWVENLNFGKKMAKPEDVARYHERWKSLREATLSRNESRGALDKLGEELRGRP